MSLVPHRTAYDLPVCRLHFRFVGIGLPRRTHFADQGSHLVGRPLLRRVPERRRMAYGIDHLAYGERPQPDSIFEQTPLAACPVAKPPEVILAHGQDQMQSLARLRTEPFDSVEQHVECLAVA